MAKERVLITVKTYPTLSRKYGETVCTAGIREDGSWMRIYPVPFRRLDDPEQYSKYDWIEADFNSSRSDQRPETFHPKDLAALRPKGSINTTDGWRERRALVLGRGRVYDRLDPLLQGAKNNQLSLATFRPTKIRDFVWESADRDWDPEKVAAMRDRSRQGELFSEESWRQTFELIPKLPYDFSYRFEDADGRVSELQVIDWECGQLYWKCLFRHGDEKIACEKVREKFLDYFQKRDLHFFLGTMQQFHGYSPNPWIIVGVFYPPYQEQLTLL